MTVPASAPAHVRQRVRRAALIVLDGLGIGATPDQAAWGDAGRHGVAGSYQDFGQIRRRGRHTGSRKGSEDANRPNFPKHGPTRFLGPRSHTASAFTYERSSIKGALAEPFPVPV